MKKRTGIMLLIGFGLIIVGASLAMIGFFGGGSRSVYVTRDGIIIPKEIEVKAYSADLPEFNSVVIDSGGNADLEIVEGAAYGFDFQPGGNHYYTKDNEKIDPADMVTVNEGVLTLSYPGLPPLSSEGIQLGVADWGAYEQDQVTITVPAGTKLESIVTADNDKSDTVRVKGVSATKVDLHSDYGTLSIAGGTFDELTLGASSGNVDIFDSTVVTGNATIKVSYGSINITGVTLGTLDASNEAGDISVFETVVEGSASVKNSYGSITLSEVSFKNGVNVTENSGDVTLTGALYGVIDVENSYGDIDVVTTLAESTYAIDAKTSYGTVSFDDAEYGTHVERANSGASNAMTIRNSSGDITIRTGAPSAATDGEDVPIDQ